MLLILFPVSFLRPNWYFVVWFISRASHIPFCVILETSCGDCEQWISECNCQTVHLLASVLKLGMKTADEKNVEPINPCQDSN